ncbi:MAG: hypothetical protein IKP47_05130 [Ruminococcus sp.]|nr:hypothetical protein [Ruminococcus sp.]
MLNQKIGITATELFACNPFRVLGVAVDTPQADIDKRYKEFLAAASAGDTASLKTEFDFNSLPPFSRDAASLRTAYAKLASNGYRCFAYSDPAFTVPLNIDDVALNLRDISCYDCFLRCYMWLVINDPDMEEKELWIQLAAYIDKLITCSPDKFEAYFDHRFPAEMIDAAKSVYRSFYVTFSEIILLPLKEMVRGAMKCDTATDILTLRGIDVKEEFEKIDIPQANAPKPGEPAPKLKLALKDGDEYFDISTGKMMSFEAVTAAKVESNVFEEAATSISADEILEEPDETSAIPDEPTVAPHYDDDDDITGHKPLSFQSTESSAATTAPRVIKRPVNTGILTKESAENAPAQPAAPRYEAPSRPSAPPPPPAPDRPAEGSDSQVVAPRLMKKKTRTSLIDEEAQAAFHDSTDINLTEISEEEEEEQNIYTQALVQMLRANKSRNQFMKDVDTKHAFNNGDTLAAPATPEALMDDINMKTYDKSLLDSPYEVVDRGSEMSREEKYRNVKIDDMLNPVIGNKTQRISYEPDPIEEFKKRKEIKKGYIKKLIVLGFSLLLIVGIVAVLMLMDLI